MNPLTIEFEIRDPGRFELLRIVFDALRVAKAAGSFTDDHSGWLVYFDDAARAKFWWPTTQEIEALSLPYQASSGVHVNFPSRHAWCFDSMIDAIRNGEYDLGECERVNEMTGRLTFFEHAYPFGGTGCMHALIESVWAPCDDRLGRRDAAANR